MLEVLSWNIRQGGGSRIRTIAKKLIARKSQILVLSEYRNNDNGALLRNILLKAGYRYQYVTNASKQENSVLIASIIPGAVCWTPLEVVDYRENLLWVKFSAFTLIGGYFPHKKKHDLFNAIVDYIEQSAEACVLVGDYNTGINYIDQVGHSFWYQDELASLLSLGMVDGFRHLHGNEKREYSWYSHQGNGYRYDHSYLSKQLLPVLKACEYIHKWREDKLSDHSPMILKLG